MTKVIIINEDEKICSSITGPTGPEHRHLANDVMKQALTKGGITFNDINYCIATGYGRINVPFADRQITELTCHAKGVASFFPEVKTAIDIGGQDSKGMKIENGKLIDFVMNDKCAAGTGRFLEVLSQTLNLKVEDLGAISMRSKKRVTISSICTIFAEQEVISQISNGKPIEDIISGLHYAIADRVVRMVKRLKIKPDVVLTGGVAMNTGVQKAVSDLVGCEVHVHENPLISGAMGAAILGKEFVEKSLSKNEPIARKNLNLDNDISLYE